MRIAACWIVFACVGRACFADGSPVDYATEIKPILTERCLACHGALKQEGGLRLDTGMSARAGGDSGPAVVPGDVEGSYLIERVTAEDASYRMPPEGEPLTAEQIAHLRAWIEQNAVSPADEEPEPDPRDHWAFRLPVRPELPAGPYADWGVNPIDSFIAARHEELGLTRVDPAEKHVLLRRVYLDLIGLPPTHEELLAFEADDSPEAYARVVERLLESPQYGERWGRHWMDVWRYADWFGRRMVPDVWNSAPQVWRWRDWIVASLNEDKGYDQMVREMLAADEISPTDYEAGVATDYLVRNWFALNPNQWMRDNLEHTGKAFLGLTFNCAHCHDHKYDPILQDEYFGFRAFFEPIGIRQDRVVGEPDPGAFVEYEYGVLRKIQRLGSVRIFDKHADAPTWFYTGGDERNRVADRGSMPPVVPAFLGGERLTIEPIDLPPEAYYPGLRPEIQQQELAAAADAVQQAEAALEATPSPTEEELAPLQLQLAEAQAALDAAIAASDQGALRGGQSLLLDASGGRRIVNNPLTSVSSLEDGSELRFELLILQDAHFNVQLAKDTQAGLTSSCIMFENGQIHAYQPGTFSPFQVGTYDVAAGQNRFSVTLRLDRAADVCHLSVQAGDEQLLVDNVPVALHGWNPIGNPLQAITLDARPGAIVAVDDIVVRTADAQADGSGTLTFDFEAPDYTDGDDILGIQGWSASHYCEAGSLSSVRKAIDNGALTAERQTVAAAQQALAVRMLPRETAAARVAAAHATANSVAARIAADNARYGVTESDDVDATVRTASLAERTARVATCEADLLAAKLARSTAETLPADNADRATQLEAAIKQIAAAESALATARTALEDPAQELTYTAFSPVYPSQSSGRRKALAEWITSPENPLTPRVAVNHIWMRHFGEPLVQTVNDFGRNGADPSHPQLLDWLAVEFVENGWSMKHLHRLIVTSATYRLASSGEAGSEAATAAIAHNEEIDPDNVYLWRAHVRRMEAEVVRDSLLAVAGKLDLTIGGQELENGEALTTFRRSLYYSCHPEGDGKSAIGRLFDGADAVECYRRTETIIPQQALALTNSDLIHSQSAAVAAGLFAAVSTAAEPESAFIERAFLVMLTRAPTDAERTLCQKYLAQQLAQLQEDSAADPAAAARESLVRVLFNHNDFQSIR